MNLKKNIFGQRIFELRTAANMTQKQLGEAVGLSMQTINGIEKGRCETGIAKAIAIAKLFDTTVEYLAGAVDDPSSHAEAYAFEYSFSVSKTHNVNEHAIFAKRLKSIRESKGFTAQEISDLYPALDYEDLESEEAIPTLFSLLILANHFNVPLDYLVGRDVNSDNPLPTVTPDEFALVEKLRALPPEKRKAIEMLLD